MSKLSTQDLDAMHAAINSAPADYQARELEGLIEAIAGQLEAADIATYGHPARHTRVVYEIDAMELILGERKAFPWLQGRAARVLAARLVLARVEGGDEG